MFSIQAIDLHIFSRFFVLAVLYYIFLEKEHEKDLQKQKCWSLKFAISLFRETILKISSNYDINEKPKTTITDR